MAEQYQCPDGVTPMDKEDFYDYYSKLYYWKNSVYAEKDIIKILYKGHPIEKKDLINILAWKVGMIDHKQSQKDKKIVIRENALSNDSLIDLRYNRRFDIRDILNRMNKYVSYNGDDLAEKFINEFKNSNNIGPVYAITLLFFFSHGKYPIYDKYAQRGLYRILGLEEKEVEPSFTNVGKIYADYIDALNTIGYCNIDLKDEAGIREMRRIDQALWVYGHCNNIKYCEVSLPNKG